MFGTNLFRITDCVSLPTFCYFVDHLWLLLEKSPFENLLRNNCLGWKFVECGRILFTLTKIMKKLLSIRNLAFISLAGSAETGKSKLIYNWLKIGTFQPKFDQFFVLSTFPTSLRCYAKGNCKSRVCAWSKL